MEPEGIDVLSSRTLIHPRHLARSLEFYGSTLGLAVAREFGEGDGRGVVFFTGGGLLEVVGQRAGAEGPDGPGDALALWFQVRSVRATVDALAARGVPVLRPPTLEPWGLVEAWIADPDGLRIHLVEVPPDHPLRRDVRADL